ncbi:MAG: hypothetical protein LUM44_11300 [Pyrinomonadaceae bacterium]|nr:hypothetical protein [Pyrinomonadaceae bacterium]
MEGYVLTTTVQKSLKRIVESFSDPFPSRAWTLTGPYGSGKSTFALFVSKLFGIKPAKELSLLKKLIKGADFNFWQTLYENEDTLFADINSSPKFFPILVSGSREPLAKAILRGILQAIEASDNKKLSIKLSKRVSSLQEEEITGRQIIEILNEISVLITNKNEKTGVLLVIDELGKLLEYVALHPTKSDVFVLQELAEATKNSKQNLFLITILHQAFERYVEKLGRRERDEWRKIQGRFEDLPFQEPNEQVLHILKDAFELSGKTSEVEEFERYGEYLAQEAFELGICGSLKKEIAVSLLKGCLPLHPTVAITLGPVFRRFGQNERSLFAFLTSNETYFGLTGFLETAEWTKEYREIIQLDRLYDYLISAMGSSLYAGSQGRKWAEIDTALNRLINSTELEFRIIKTIGLLNLLGDIGKLKSSDEILKFALRDDKVEEKEIENSLQNLIKKSVIIKRNFNDTFAIWEGSDIDLDERFRQATQQIDPSVSLNERLEKNFSLKPIVAKRHSYQTGTLRFFETAYANINNIEEVCSKIPSEADGQIVYVFTNSQEEFNEIVNKIKKAEIKTNSQTIVALPKDLETLNDAVYAVDCWNWVRQNTPELQNDRTARNELTARLSYVEKSVQKWLNQLQSGKSGEQCEWFWKNDNTGISDTKSLQEFLSKVCDSVFYKTPILKNELINRRNLSGAANSARKSLFDSMLKNSNEYQLGIQGYPPQLSIYFSLLQETTIHREENGRYGFYPPNYNADKGIQSVWKEIEKFLQKTERNRLTVAELFEILKKPPFGLKQGVLPTLFGAVLLHYDSELALYENGSFVPKLNLPIFEKLYWSPETFSLQLCKIEGVRSQVIEELANKLLPVEVTSKQKQFDILTIIRPLVKFAREMDEFTRNTRRLSLESQKVRHALFSAREPDTLIFKQLPEAFGLKEFNEKQAYSETQVSEFCKKLLNSLSEIKRIYDELLRDLEAMLFGSFNIKELGEKGRAELAKKVEVIADYVSSPKLKSFILRITDPNADFRSWLESLGELVVNKRIASWDDEDFSIFEINLAEIVRSYVNFESLAFELKQKEISKNINIGEVIRLSLTKFGDEEQEKVLTIKPNEKNIIEKLEVALEKEFEDANLNGNYELRLIVLANLSWKILQQIKTQ